MRDNVLSVVIKAILIIVALIVLVKLVEILIAA